MGTAQERQSAETRPAASAHPFWICVVTACFAVKLGFLFFDSDVRLFMGDSATYLFSAIHHAVLPDRSFTYPWLIGATAAKTASIATLLIVQTLCGIGTASLVCLILREHFDVSRRLALVAAILVAAEPAQLFYERMVMTESVSTFVLVASIAIAFAYLRNGRLRDLLVCIGLGLLLASLRVGLVPIAVLLGATCVLLRWSASPSKRAWAVHLAIAIVVTWSIHSAYQIGYALRRDCDPAYIRDGGLFQLGLVAPLVRASDFENTGVDPALLGEVKIPLANPHLREAQIWQPNGLIDVLKTRAGERAYRVAAVVAGRVIRENPLGLARLGWQTTLEYLDGARRNERLWSDLGSGELPNDATLELLRTRFNYDATGVARRPSPVYNYFANSALWMTCCLFALAPLSIASLAIGWRNHRRAAALLGLLGAGFVAGQILCSHIISFRYLHPFPVLAILCTAVVLRVFRTQEGPHARAFESTDDPVRDAYAFGS